MIFVQFEQLPCTCLWNRCTISICSSSLVLFWRFGISKSRRFIAPPHWLKLDIKPAVLWHSSESYRTISRCRVYTKCTKKPRRTGIRLIYVVQTYKYRWFSGTFECCVRQKTNDHTHERIQITRYWSSATSTSSSITHHHVSRPQKMNDAKWGRTWRWSKRLTKPRNTVVSLRSIL